MARKEHLRRQNLRNVQGVPQDQEDIEGKVDKNQFGTIELHAGSPRKLLDISLTTEKVQLASLRRVVDLEFEHFKLKG